MARSMVVLAALVIVLPAAAFAGDDPIRKPGLWEITITTKGAPGRVSRLCLDAAIEAELIKKGDATKASICSHDERHRSGNVYTSDSVCRPMSSEMTSHSVTTFTSDTSYTLATTTHYNPPFMGQTDQEMTQEGKWLGPCGPDMKPGDMIVGGHKLRVGGAP